MLLGLLVISVAVLGCANQDRVETSAYQQELTRARASITEAEQAGAAQFGGAELALARDKLREAERAIEDGAGERARRLAVEADLDADLAAAITRSEQTQALATEVRAGLATLEQELRRAQPTDGARR
jgi:hypothetical protein